MLIEFDLTIPVELQLTGARRILESFGATNSLKRYTGQIVPSLRVMDAKSDLDKPSFGEIGEILYPDSEESASAAAKLHQSAKKLMESISQRVPPVHIF
ncbi:MAG: hypothetical protein ACYDAM_01960 [Leptospirales bacterium]